MANTIVYKNSSVASKVPLTTDLVPGEFAINTIDGKLFVKKDDNTVVEVSGELSTGSIQTNQILDGTVGDIQLLETKLELSGGTMTGNISGITPTQTQHLARKDYVDTIAANTVYNDKALVTKTFVPNEEFSITLSSPSPNADVVILKEVTQINENNSKWDLSATNGFLSINSALDSSITPNGVIGRIVLTLGTGAFTTDDIGKTIYLNGGSVGLVDITGRAEVFEELDSTTSVPTGEWTMYGIIENENNLTTSAVKYNFFEFDPIPNLQGYSNTYTYDNDILCAEFNDTGSKMYMIGREFDKIFTYDLSPNFDVTTAVYNGQSSDLGFNITKMRFSADGKLLFVMYQANDYIYSFNLSTAYDITTTSYSTNFGYAGQETTGYGFSFANNGMNMYIIGNNDAVYQYSLATPWDLSTVGYVKSRNLSNEDQQTYDIYVSKYGDKMFMLGAVNDRIYEYTLSTPFDVSTSTYTGKSVLVYASVGSITFNPSGSKMFATRYVSISDCRTNAYNIGLFEELANKEVAITSAIGQIDTTNWTTLHGLTIEDNTNAGLITYALSQDDGQLWVTLQEGKPERQIARNNSSTWEYNNSEIGFDLNTITYMSSTILNSVDVDNIWNVTFSPDGTKMFALGQSPDFVYAYDLSTAYDIPTAVYTNNKFPSDGQGSGSEYGLRFSPSGKTMFILKGPYIYEYDLYIAWDVTTSVYNNQSMYIGSQTGTHYGMAFGNNGMNIFTLGSNDVVYKYNLPNAYSLIGATYANNSKSVTAQDSNTRGIEFNSSGTKMFMVGTSYNKIYQYTMSTPWLVSSASYNFSRSTTSPTSISVSYDGTRMYVMSDISSNAYQYNASVASPINNWLAATDNSKTGAISDASQLPQNWMFSSDAGKLTSNEMSLTGDTMDLAVTMKTFSGDPNDQPIFNSAIINFSGNIRHKGAGSTDFSHFQQDNSTIVIKNLSGTTENFAIRII